MCPGTLKKKGLGEMNELLHNLGANKLVELIISKDKKYRMETLFEKVSNLIKILNGEVTIANLRLTFIPTKLLSAGA